MRMRILDSIVVFYMYTCRVLYGGVSFDRLDSSVYRTINFFIEDQKRGSMKQQRKRFFEQN